MSQNEPLGLEAARKSARRLAPGEVSSLLQSSTVRVLHVGSSADFAFAHLPGSKWISRGWLELKLPSLLTDKAQPHRAFDAVMAKNQSSRREHSRRWVTRKF